MNRMVIQLRPDQHARLRLIARKEHKSMAELVRQAIDSVIEEEAPVGDRKKRASAVSGMLKGGPPDLSAGHDQFVWED